MILGLVWWKAAIIALAIIAALYGIHRLILHLVTESCRKWADKKDMERDYWNAKFRDGKTKRIWYIR